MKNSLTVDGLEVDLIGVIGKIESLAEKFKKEGWHKESSIRAFGVLVFAAGMETGIEKERERLKECGAKVVAALEDIEATHAELALKMMPGRGSA